MRPPSHLLALIVGWVAVALATCGSGAAPTASPTPSPAPPDIDTIPWHTGSDVGYGVAMKETGNRLGNNFFIGYAGYEVTLDSAEAWVTALYKAELVQRGVRTLWAVQGPSNSVYSTHEIANSKIVAALLPRVTSSTRFVVVVGHSSGSFVAHELFAQLAGGLDPQGLTANLVTYFDLDGGRNGLTDAIVARLRRAYFVASNDRTTGTLSPNATSMRSMAATYSSAGGYWENDASDSGCAAGAAWCVHNTLISTRPHDPAAASPADYRDFEGRPVCASYIEAKSAEAGLAP